MSSCKIRRITRHDLGGVVNLPTVRSSATALLLSMVWLSSGAQNTPPQNALVPYGASPNGPSSAHPGKAIYDRACAACHTAPVDARTPKFASLTAMTPSQLHEAMSEGGKMAPMAAGLNESDRSQLVGYLTSGQSATAADWTASIMCPAAQRDVDTRAPIVAAGFAIDPHQMRRLTAAQAGIKANELKQLEVAWTLAFPNAGSGTGASIAGTTMFVTGGGRLLALDTATGCVKWSQALTSRNTPALGEVDGRRVIALSSSRDVVLIDARTGQKIWQANGQATDNVGSIRGGVVIHQDRIIVPISASGVGAGRQPQFECCVGHGAVVALSAKDGSKLWEYHTMPTAQYNGKVSSTGLKQRGPSFEQICSMPLIYAKRGRVLVTTGENTSHPATETSDAVIAIDLASGKEVWTFQAMPHDVWNMACGISKETSGPNCPWNIDGDSGAGRDFDFGAGAVLVENVAGKDMILAGQKSGDTWALDADTGKLLWNLRIGEGTPLGGVHWGITSDGQHVYVPINDPLMGGSQVARPGVFAIDIASGKQTWGYDARPNCAGERGKLVKNCAAKYGFSAAPLVIDGAVVAATLGGEVMILDGKTGALLNTLDTVGPHKTLNGVAGSGGSIDSHALSAGAGMLFINSGYAAFNQTPGNVLIAYRPKR